MNKENYLNDSDVDRMFFRIRSDKMFYYLNYKIYNKKHMYVLTENDEPLSMCVYYSFNNYIHIVYTKINNRRKGHATNLYNFIEKIHNVKLISSGFVTKDGLLFWEYRQKHKSNESIDG